MYEEYWLTRTSLARTYVLTCTDGDSSTVTATTTDLEHTFTDADGILGDVQYACYVAVTYPDGSTSPRSNPAIITVTGGVSKSNATHGSTHKKVSNTVVFGETAQRRYVYN